MAASTEANGTSAYAVSAKVPVVAHPLAEEPAEIASNINYHSAVQPSFVSFQVRAWASVLCDCRQRSRSSCTSKISEYV